MKTGALFLSEVPPMQGAHARRDGVLFQPWSVWYSTLGGIWG